MIYSLPEYTQKLRIDLRRKTVHNEALRRVHADHKRKIARLEEEKRQLKKELDKFKKENEKLKQTIERLTKTKNRYQVALFDHGNFSHPTEGKHKPSGGQVGHPDTNKDSLRNYDSFIKQHIYATNCGVCGTTLSRATGSKKKILIDIEINTQVLHMIISSERQWCKSCHKEVRARHSQSLPFTEYGMNTFMVVMYLRFKGKQSQQTIATTLTGLFGLQISKSGVGTLLIQAKEYLTGKYEELKQAVRQGEIMYNDETGWSVRGNRAWMWIMANKDTTVYVPSESRGKGIMEEMYGNSQSYSMHDGYAGYTNTVPKDKQLYCWAHILRFVYEETILEEKGSIACLVRDRLVSLYKIIRSHPEYKAAQKEQLLIKELDEILATPQDTQTIKNILQRLKTQREGLIRSLLVTQDGTNNLAERELRPLTISRNISYGSGSFNGMQTSAILASITQTITRDKDKQFLPTLSVYIQTGIQKKYSQYKHIPRVAT